MLGYLGVEAFRAGVTPPSPEAPPPTRHPFVVGFGIGIANPIPLLWFLTVGGALIAAQGGGGMAACAVAFGTSFVIGVLCWDTVIAALAGAGRRWMGSRTPRALTAIARVVFFGFALRLAWKFLQTSR